jgi:Putative peptidoglycan binding domain
VIPKTLLKYPPFAANARFVLARRGVRPLRRGDAGTHVQLLQGALIDLGFKMPRSVRANGFPDAIFGAETESSVKAFQGKHYLVGDGLAGAKTLAKLDAAMVSHAKSAPHLTFNMFPGIYSPEYTLGTAPPATPHDPGSGAWNSRPKTMVARAQMAAIRSILPIAYVAVGDDAVKHLQHYFGNSGGALTIDAEGMVREVPSAQRVYRIEVGQAKSFVESLPPGRHDITSRKTNGGYNRQSESKNWFFAVGGYSAWGRGRVEIAPAPVQDIVLEFEYCVYDRYNWDKGKSVTIHDITITDEFMGEFHRQGLAQEYDEVGSFKRRFHWRRGQAISADQY